MFSHILSPLQTSTLDEVLVAPVGRVAIVFPRLVDTEISEVVSIIMIESCFLLVCYLLFLLRAVKDVLD